jgi:hypothetical protein
MSYQSELKKWKEREPKTADNYLYEKWLDERPNPRFRADGKPRDNRKRK